ncbi:MAG: hypothetical protein WD048_07680 [Chitinophagales bacterium]
MGRTVVLLKEELFSEYDFDEFSHQNDGDDNQNETPSHKSRDDGPESADEPKWD